MKIVLGSDHAGFTLKERVKSYLAGEGIETLDVGTHSAESVDYPDYAERAAKEILRCDGNLGILACSTGIGICVAANKIKGIRAVAPWTPEIARLCREHNNANVLCLSGCFMKPESAMELVKAYLETSFERGGRHERRARKISELEQRFEALKERYALGHLSGVSMKNHIFTVDPEVAAAIASETRRQNETLELIASENFVSEAVLEAVGSVFTNKYAEGYPGRRYYGGCEFVDVVETLVQERAKKLFGAEHVNAQPHSGNQANVAVYMAVCKPGDTILGMSLAHGGHLTHGHPLNFSGRMYQVHSYGVRSDTEQIDYDELGRLAEQHKPKLIICGASAYPRIIDFPRIAGIARSVGALSMGDIAHIAGLVAAGLHPSPFPHMDFVTTTTHKTLRGPRGGLIMCKEAFAKDLDRNVFPGTQGGPLVHIIAAKAVCLQEALQPGFADYQRQIVANAGALARMLVSEGFRLVSGGTDNHLMLVDVFSQGVTGKDAEKALERSNITVNKNAIPFDKNPPMVASGIRVGTPAVTSRGMRESEMETIGRLIARVLRSPSDSDVQQNVRGEVLELTARYPLYEERR